MVSNSVRWKMSSWKITVPRLHCLHHSPIHHFKIVPNSKKMQMTTEMWQLKDFKIQVAWKTLWKKVKLLIHLFLQYFPKAFFFNALKWIYMEERVNPFPNKPWFLRVCSTSLLKTLWEKEKLLVTSNFSFSSSVFYPIFELSTIFIKFKIVVCKPFEFGRV